MGTILNVNCDTERVEETGEELGTEGAYASVECYAYMPV